MVMMKFFSNAHPPRWRVDAAMLMRKEAMFIEWNLKQKEKKKEKKSGSVIIVSRCAATQWGGRMQQQEEGLVPFCGFQLLTERSRYIFIHSMMGQDPEPAHTRMLSCSHSKPDITTTTTNTSESAWCHMCVCEHVEGGLYEYSPGSTPRPSKAQHCCTRHLFSSPAEWVLRSASPNIPFIGRWGNTTHVRIITITTRKRSEKVSPGKSSICAICDGQGTKGLSHLFANTSTGGNSRPTNWLQLLSSITPKRQKIVSGGGGWIQRSKSKRPIYVQFSILRFYSRRGVQHLEDDALYNGGLVLIDSGAIHNNNHPVQIVKRYYLLVK